MLKKIVSLSLISLLGLTMSACGTTSVDQNPEQKDEVSLTDNAALQEAENIIKQFEATQASVTYKDPSSFNAGDKYLTPDFAEKYHGEMRTGMAKFIKDSKATVTGETPNITFNKQDEDDVIFNFEVDRTISIEEPNQSIASHVEYLVTVTKQNDGSYLISDMVEAE